MSITRYLRITVAGKVYDVTAELLDESPSPSNGAAPLQNSLSAAPVTQLMTAKSSKSSKDGTVLCPISGFIVAIHVKSGQQVAKGDLLVTLEAMKMNTPVYAPQNGVVTSINAQAGSPIEEGAVLVVLS